MSDLPPDERARLATNRRKVVAYLLEHGQATNVQLYAEGGNRAVGRLWEAQAELRQAGYTVEKARLRGGLWLYRLVPVRPPAAPVQAELWERSA